MEDKIEKVARKIKYTDARGLPKRGFCKKNYPWDVSRSANRILPR